MKSLPIIDSFGRTHTSIRIGVTDRCNIRCFYCMPETVKFMPQADVLTFEEIHRLVQVLAKCGVDRIRLTGGEPLVRAQIWKLITMLRSVEGIREIALTTNGLLLADQAEQLRSAGLDRLNVSLDTIDPDRFKQITRRKGLDKVLAGIEAAQAAGFSKIRINAVSIVGISETEIVPLARFSREKDLQLRFIEFMPLDGDEAWQTQQVLSGAKVRQIITEGIGPLVPGKRPNASQPAIDYSYSDGKGSVGFINSVTEPFCGACDRMRVTAEGKFRNCLFSSVEWDVRDALRGDASDEEIEAIVRQCVKAKKSGHGTDDGQFHRPEKAMYQIGG
ncbi:MAG: cyclic pyranopterin phosphate synthase [Mariniblastus sp.]|jgi:cyclic pyranopterin phosphate synthase